MLNYSNRLMNFRQSQWYVVELVEVTLNKILILEKKKKKKS